MKIRKIFFAAAALALFSFAPIFGQEANAPNASEQEQNSSQAQDAARATKARAKWYNACGGSHSPAKSAKEFFGQISPFINIGAAFMINTESKLKSAPSPTSFALSIGLIWPNQAFLSFQPRLNFWWSYWLWDGEMALPAEIENRTALALNFMLDIPAAATFRFKNCQIEAGLGLGILARVALLAGGVSEDDPGTTGSAGGDKEKIQEWFWSGSRFLYPEVFVAWEWRFSPRIAAGLEARYYFPLGAFMDGRGLDASIIAVSGKLIF